MIILSNTTDTIKAVLAGSVTTNQLQCVASYRDNTTSLLPNRSVVLTNNTTAINLVAAPAASVQRIVDYISIYNNDTTSANIRIYFDANGTSYNLFQVTLASLEKLEYNDKKGWVILNNNGGVKTGYGFYDNSYNLNSPIDQIGYNTTVLNRNIVINPTNNTLVEIPELSIPLLSGKQYYVKAYIRISNQNSSNSFYVGFKASRGTFFIKAINGNTTTDSYSNFSTSNTVGWGSVISLGSFGQTDLNIDLFVTTTQTNDLLLFRPSFLSGNNIIYAGSYITWYQLN